MKFGVVVSLLLLLLLRAELSFCEQDKPPRYNYENCHYKFHVWKPEENVLEKMRDLENTLNHSRLNMNNEVLVLKVQVRKQQEILKTLSKNSLALRNKETELRPANYELSGRETQSVSMTSLKSSVSDLKGEWVLLKRQFHNLHSDHLALRDTLTSTTALANNTRLKLEEIQHGSCASDRQALEKRWLDDAVQEVDNRFLAHMRNNINKVADDLEKLQRGVKELKQEQQTMKNQIFLLAMLQNDTEGLPFSQLIDAIVSPSIHHSSTLPYKNHYSDCDEARKDGHRTDGIYRVRLPHDQRLVEVFCNMAADGGWLVIQRRVDGSLNFNRNWLEYKHGFGNLYGEFWLGNEYLHHVTSHRKNYQLSVELRDFSNKEWSASFKLFSVGSEKEKYRLTIREYQGNSGDSLSYNDEMNFSTGDQDNDNDIRNCAEVMKGGWWYNGCSYSNLNGLYKEGTQAIGPEAIHWFTIYEDETPLKHSLMKIRPLE